MDSCGIYSIPKESKYRTIFLSINNETQCVPLLCLSSRKYTIKPRLVTEILSKLCIA